MKKTLSRKIISLILSLVLIATSLTAMMAMPVSAEIVPTTYVMCLSSKNVSKRAPKMLAPSAQLNFLV